MSTEKNVGEFINELKRAGVRVAGPDVNRSEMAFSVDGDFAIRRDAPDAYSFIRFPKRARSTLAVFATYGDSKQGNFDIPPAGLSAFRALLPRLAAVAPVQGEKDDVRSLAEL